jgi:hypothetical protein
MGYTFLNLAEDTLTVVGRPLSAKEIWENALKFPNIKNSYAIQLNSSGKTPWRTLSAVIPTDIRKNSNTTLFEQKDKNPAKFYLKAVKILYNIKKSRFEKLKKEPDEVFSKETYTEKDLHKLLSKFVDSDPHFRCNTKTIDEKHSKTERSGYNKWLHPDLVGIYFPFIDFHSDTLNLISVFKESAYTLFSFEMKKKLNLRNLKECYLQAVSNSSWANEGYLVALKIDDDPDFNDEITRLNNSFGIEIIKLDAENIAESEILRPAKTNKILDWKTINRLVEENIDFKKFINDLMEDIAHFPNKSLEDESKYDKILDDDAYKTYVENKGFLK